PSLSGSVGLSITVGAVASVHVAYSQASGSAATVVLSCTGKRCTGALKLTAVERLRGKTPTSVSARVKQRVTKRTITLASGHYSLNAGATRVIKVKLNGKGVTLLHRLGKISARLTLTPTGARKPALIKTLTFRYKRA
ncbi:MAG: hypothetical protein KGL16_02795, partial [Acidobacteriota bacterium]|nr:hypothetical protein [Acidobacteriota bacterium]